MGHRSRIRRLAGGRAISAAGSSAAYVALSFSIYARTGSGRWIAAALLASVVVTIAVAPVAGALGDRHDRRRLMVLSDVAAAVVFVALSLTGRTWLVVALFGLASAVEAPFAPAAGAAVANLVPEHERPWANGLLAAAASAGYVAGPLVGGVLVARVGAATAFQVNAASFLVSALLVTGVRVPFQVVGAARVPARALDGLRAIRSEARLRALVACGSATMMAWGLVNVAGAPLAVRLGAGASGFGAMETAAGVGGLLGAAAAARIIVRRGERRSLAASVLATGLCLALAAAVPAIAVVVGALLLAGIARGLAEVAEAGILQSAVPDEGRSGALAAVDAVAHGAFAAAFVVGGVAIDGPGPRVAVALAALVAALGLVPAWRLARGS